MAFVRLILGTLIAGSFLAGQGLVDARFSDPGEWLSYDGDNTGRRFSRLAQVNTGNVKRLRAAWAYQLVRIPQRTETTPLVRDGIMYITGGGQEAFALDATTGRAIWSFHHVPATTEEGGSSTPQASAVPRRPGGIRMGADWNRGLALLGNRAFMATVDCHLVALDARSGALLWRTQVRDSEPCFGTTAAPLVVKNLVLIGVRGGDTGFLRGHLDAYDSETGKRVWRFYTVPAPGENHSETWPPTSVWKVGGAATWTAGTYDPDLNLLYWPIGNPGPKDFDGSDREGDNLYSDSVVALEPSSGKLVWHYQFTPHDVWDWDANETPVLIDAEWKGRPRKLLAQANRNSFLYLLDRVNGKFLMAAPFAKQTWAKAFSEAGRPILNDNVIPTRKGNRVCPDVHGGTNWQAPSYNPATRLFYVVARDSCGIYFPTGPSIDTETSAPRQFLRAVELDTGRVRWEIPFLGAGSREITHAGAMTTAGGLVFFSSRDGQFIAADAETGKVLWNFNTGGSIRASPMTYSVNGRQYVAIATKAAVFSFTLPNATEE